MSEHSHCPARQLQPTSGALVSHFAAGMGLMLALAACSSAEGDAPLASGGSGGSSILQAGASSGGTSASGTTAGTGTTSAGTTAGGSAEAGSANAGTGVTAGSGGTTNAGSGGVATAGGGGVAAGGGETGGSASGGGGGSGGTAPQAVCSPGLPSSVADLASSTSQSTVSKVTPMGTRYDEPSKHVATNDDIAFFHDASKQPPIPGSTSGLHLQAMSVTLYPSGGAPTPADVNQHAIGNCDGDTAFAAMAYLNPSFIQSLITDNHDNTYTVAMYDPLGQRMTISLDNQFLVDSSNKNLGAVSGKKGEADWATVLEKATMKYIKVFPVVGDIGGIGSEHQTPMFTGKGGSFAFDRGKLSPNDLARVVKASLAAGKIISGGFGIEGKALASGLQTVTAHGYAVFVAKDASTMISMRNPWGLDPTDHGYDASTDGVLDIPFDKSWSDTIDLRIIDPGDACGPGATSPYVPLPANVSAKSLYVSQVHARKAAR